VSFIRILDDQNLKHARQAKERCSRQKDDRSPAPCALIPCRNRRCLDLVQSCRRPAADSPNNENPDGKQRCEFDNRFDRDRHDNTVVAFIRIKIASAEQDGEKPETNSDPCRSCVQLHRGPNGAACIRKDREG